MTKEKIYNMSFEKIYALLLNKVERKNRTKEELNELIFWLMGYKNVDELINNSITYGEFIEKAQFNSSYKNIKGTICGVKIEEIKDPFMKKVRCLDKVIDELSKGKEIEKIIKKYE